MASRNYGATDPSNSGHYTAVAADLRECMPMRTMSKEETDGKGEAKGSTTLQMAWNIANAVQGVSALSLPYAVSQGGLIALIAFLLIAALSSFTGKVWKLGHQTRSSSCIMLTALCNSSNLGTPESTYPYLHPVPPKKVKFLPGIQVEVPGNHYTL